jgi:hypothetical protein
LPEGDFDVSFDKAAMLARLSQFFPAAHFQVFLLLPAFALHECEAVHTGWWIPLDYNLRLDMVPLSSLGVILPVCRTS